MTSGSETLWLTDASIPPFIEETIKANEVILHHLCDLCTHCLATWLLGHWGTAEYSCSSVMQADFLLASRTQNLPPSSHC